MYEAQKRKIAAAYKRALVKSATPPNVRGVVEDVDVTASTATVWVGTKLVSAYYGGTPPESGDSVVLSQDGPTWLITQIVAKPSVTGGAAGQPNLTPLAGGGRPPIAAFSFWGHSYTHSPAGGISSHFDFSTPWYPAAGGISPMLPWRIDRVLASMLGLPETKVRHFGVGGAILLSDQHPVYPNAAMGWIQPGTKHYGWAWILQNTSRGPLNRYGWAPQRDPTATGFAPYDTRTYSDSQFSPFMPASTAHVLLYGTNDVGEWGDPTATVDGVAGMMLTAWTETNRSVISRLRAGGIIEDTLLYSAVAPLQPYGVSYTGTWSTVAQTFCNSGTSLTGMTSGSGTIVIHLGAEWPGGVLSVRFRAEAVTGGTFTVPGGTAVSVAHRMPATFTSITRYTDVAGQTSTAYKTVPPWTPSFGTLVRRIPVKRTGVAQTVTIAVNAAAGPVWFDSCDLEQTGMAAPVVAGNIALPARWMAAYATSPRWAAYPDNCQNADGSLHQSGVTGANIDSTARGTQSAEAGDTWAGAYNAALGTLASEFAEMAPDGQTMNSVVVADLALAANGVTHPELYRPEDGLHPNASGTAAMAGAYYRALATATAHPLAPAALGAA